MARQRMAPGLTVLVAAAALTRAAGLYFFVTEGQQRCFIEEVPADTLIVGKYKNPDFIPFGQPSFNGVVSIVATAAGGGGRCVVTLAAFSWWCPSAQGIKITVQDPVGTIVSTKPADTEVRYSCRGGAAGH